ncbi:LysR family transcriptional regulator [Edaphobacter sp. HDX4]|uniref:LysR family transcriptional regulator n=1 Tax=Edaphobacter sp. HDX4 TaxID=2794064 RepID=UPI003FA5F84B
MRVEIELRQIQYFLAIAEERSFTRAAQRCHVAQPSLSRQIHEVERVLGAKLFDRLPREARITPAGEIFAKEASRALEHSRRAVAHVRALERQNTQSLRIGLSTVCDLPRVRGLIRVAQRSSSGTSMECVTATSAQLSLALVRGRIDLAFVDLPIPGRGLDVFPIHTEPLVVALPTKHPLSQRPIVRLFELKHQRIGLVSKETDPAATTIETMLQETPIRWSENLIDLLDGIATDGRIGLLRSSAARLKRDGVIYKPLTDSIVLQTAVAGRKGDHRASVQSFRDALRTFALRTSCSSALRRD